MNVQSSRYEAVAQNDRGADAAMLAGDGEADGAVGLQIEQMQEQIAQPRSLERAMDSLRRAAGSASEAIERLQARVGEGNNPQLAIFGGFFGFLVGMNATYAFGPAAGVAFTAASVLTTISSFSADDNVADANTLLSIGGGTIGVIAAAFTGDHAGNAFCALGGQVLGRGAAHFITRSAVDAQAVAVADQEDQGVALQH